MKAKIDYLIVGSGVSGLYCALNLLVDKNILIITKDKVENSDSYLAQGGICVQKNDNDFNSFFNDTMKAGHYENDSESVKIMIESSRDVINDLINDGVDFDKCNGYLSYTKEAAHATSRILHHKDITGKEITSKLLSKVKQLPNVEILDYTTMIDLISEDNICYGVIARNVNGEVYPIISNYTILACGGIGGLYQHSTNFSHLTGDGLAVSLKHNIKLQNIDYIQIHPTTLYSKKPGRRFLISESVRGEGAVLYNKNKERFVDELLPRDVVATAIYNQMEIDNMPYVWLSLERFDPKKIITRFPNIYEYCLNEGYDITKEYVPVVPAQHYFMGGIKVNYQGNTSMERLYAIGETSCNGVHGANRLASNSLLESLVFAKRASRDMSTDVSDISFDIKKIYLDEYDDYDEMKNRNKQMVLQEIAKRRSLRE